jgi:hypothetical protein
MAYGFDYALQYFSGPKMPIQCVILILVSQLNGDFEGGKVSGLCGQVCAGKYTITNYFL